MVLFSCPSIFFLAVTQLSSSRHRCQCFKGTKLWHRYKQRDLQYCKSREGISLSLFLITFFYFHTTILRVDIRVVRVLVDLKRIKKEFYGVFEPVFERGHSHFSPCVVKNLACTSTMRRKQDSYTSMAGNAYLKLHPRQIN